MQKFRATIIFTDSKAEGRFEFEAPDQFILGPAHRVIETFLSSVQGLELPGTPIDCEINSSHNFRDNSTVAAMGRVILDNNTSIPFIAMINRV